MSIALSFDTHEFITTLESSGIPKPQAEAQAHALRRVLEAALEEQTKAQQEAITRAIDELDSKTEKAIALLRKDMENGFALMDARFTAMETKFALQMEALQNKLLIKLSLVMVGLVGLLVTAQRFFP